MKKETKMQFYYLGKSYGSKLPKTDSFKAYKYTDKETKKITLYPITDNNDKEIFIYGIGHKKIAKTKVIDVPVFDLNPNHWDEYREKYGDYCLYYSIDGTTLDSWDCCQERKRQEYKSILMTGVKKYDKFINLFNKLAGIQMEVIKSKYLPLIQKYTGFAETYLLERYTFMPQYNEIFSFCIIKATPDILRDDRQMENLYKDYRTAVLKDKSEDYKEYLKLEEEKKQFRENYKKEHNTKHFGIDSVPYKIYAEYENLDEKCYECYRKVTKEIDEIVDNEINTDNDIFPTSVEDRIKYLFGEEALNLYNKLVDRYL